MSGLESDRYDDDLVLLARSEHDNTLYSIQFLNVINALCDLGEYTIVLGLIFGHKDNLSHTNDPLLENTLLLLQGDPDLPVKINSYLQTCRVPPAALAYPSYKVHTVLLASSDVGLRFLHLDVHFGTQQNHSATHQLQHVSWIRRGSETIFFPEGAGILDWTRRENNGHSVGGNHQRVAKRRNVGN